MFRAWIQVVFIMSALFGQLAWADVPHIRVWTLFDGEAHLKADGSRGPYRISGRAVDSAQVWVAGVLQVVDRDYQLDALRAQVTFFKHLKRGDNIVVRFRQTPLVVDKVYRRRVLTESTERDEYVHVGQRRPSVAAPKEDDSKLEIGGRKSIQVTFGSAQNHRVSQALHLHIAGEVTDGVSVLAVLSDQNLPVGAQGNTVGIRELDRVLFQVQGPHVAAEVGDLDVRFDRTHFGQYRRQLQGAQVQVEKEGGQLSAVGAVSRGQWHTHRVAGIEGYQGPYQLPGANGFLATVVPESERVFLDGQLLRRGEQLDYVLDYERGVITFAPERPIVASSRILVEYQLLDEGKNSRLVGLEGAVQLGQSGWTVGSTLIRESDQAVLSGVETLGSGGAHRQVAGVDATFAPRDGIRLRSEVAWSDQVIQNGHAVDVDGVWTSVENGRGTLQVLGNFRQMSVGFEGFEGVDWGRNDGRWGWQVEERLQDVREGEVGVKYTVGSVAVHGAWGRRSGDWSADRRSVGVRVPFGHYHYEHVGRSRGGLTRQRGEVVGQWGILESGVRGDFEQGIGEGVASTSIFLWGEFAGI